MLCPRTIKHLTSGLAPASYSQCHHSHTFVPVPFHYFFPQTLICTFHSFFWHPLPQYITLLHFAQYFKLFSLPGHPLYAHFLTSSSPPVASQSSHSTSSTIP